MYVNGKHISKLQPQDIVDLIDNSVKENINLEYKQALNISDDKGKKEFVRDVTSFFNTEGGCIIYGIQDARDTNKQPTGYPDKILSVTVDNWDKLENQMYQVVRNETDPAISNLVARHLVIGADNVIILGIPQRLGLPAMVTHHDNNNFFKRSPAGKYVVNAAGLNEMFMESLELRSQIKKFVDRRISQDLRDMIANYTLGPLYFMHITPFSFLGNKFIDIKTLSRFEDDHLLNPIRNSRSDMLPAHYSRFNFDGYKTSIRSHKDVEVSYLQVFRNGPVEFSTTAFGLQGGMKMLQGCNLIVNTIFAILRIMELYQKLEILPPYLLNINVLHTNKVMLLAQGVSYPEDFINSDKLSLLPVFLEKNDYSQFELFQLLNDNFDTIWQAAGKRQSPGYDEMFSKGALNQIL